MSAIPASMTFELLNTLPPNSFVFSMKEIRPDTQPQSDKYIIGGANARKDRVSFSIRGAPNEIMLNTGCYLSGTAYIKLRVTDAPEVTGPPAKAAGIDDRTAISNQDLAEFAKYPSTVLNAPIHFFQNSRESFNAGSLPYLDNGDPKRSHEFNELRYRLAKRNQDPVGGFTRDLKSSSSTSYRRLRNPGDRTLDDGEHSAPIRLLHYSHDAGAVQCFSFGKNLDFKIPLGVYSNMVNCHSVLPIGLFSSYSVNGWTLDLDTSNQNELKGPVFFHNETMFTLQTHNSAKNNTPLDPPEVIMKDLRIHVAIIKILDPNVMNAILSLYEKRQTVNVGGVSFPLSLRLNTIAYRTASFPLNTTQADYYFRIVGTDRSVRALAYKVYKRGRNTEGFWNLEIGENLNVTRIETRIGMEEIHPVVEDKDPQTSNVSNFISSQIKRSGALFSPLPYYQEIRKFDGDGEDDLDPYNNALQNYSLAILDNTGNNSVFRNSLCYGVISFENLDRREADYSGALTACGKDLTNYGAIEMRMRIQVPVPPEVTTTSTIDACDGWTFASIDNNDYEIVFMYAYDSVIECSPSGMTDISNATI